MQTLLANGTEFLYNRFKVRVLRIVWEEGKLTEVVVRKVNHPESHTLHIPVNQLPKRLRP